MTQVNDVDQSHVELPFDYSRLDDVNRSLIDFAHLCFYGWATLNPQSTAKLRSALTSLQDAAKVWFDNPKEQKEQYELPNSVITEEGYHFSNSASKEMLTIRSSVSCPEELSGDASTAWTECMSITHHILKGISLCLGHAENHFTRLLLGQNILNADRQHTILRLFRYDANPQGIVSDPHRDLGLVTIVFSQEAGLEVDAAGPFVPVEALSPTEAPVTVLLGNTLSVLAGLRMAAGRHRVRGLKFQRHSIVFAARPTEDVDVEPYKQAFDDVRHVSTKLQLERVQNCGELYHNIESIHRNVNR